MQVVSQPTSARPHHLCDREIETTIWCCELTGLTLGSRTSSVVAFLLLMHRCSPVPITCFNSVRHFQVLPWCRCFVIYRTVFQSWYNHPTKHMCSICNCNTQNMHSLAYVACFGLFLCVSWLLSVPCFDNVWCIWIDVVRKLSSVRSWPFHYNLRVW